MVRDASAPAIQWACTRFDEPAGKDERSLLLCVFTVFVGHWMISSGRAGIMAFSAGPDARCVWMLFDEGVSMDAVGAANAVALVWSNVIGPQMGGTGNRVILERIAVLIAAISGAMPHETSFKTRGEMTITGRTCGDNAVATVRLQTLFSWSSTRTFQCRQSMAAEDLDLAAACQPSSVP